MTHYNVHLYREMRLTFTDIEADTPEAAAMIARERPTDQADGIDDCEGENLAALVDVPGDQDHEQSVLIAFEPERQRHAAARLLAALQGLLDHAENEAFTLEQLKDRSDAEAEAKRAWEAVETAIAAIAAAIDAGLPCVSDEPDIEALLARRRQIAVVWGVDDVREIRPDLTPEQAWEVLRQANDHHDAGLGISWDTLACHADLLFGDAPETDDEEES